MNIFILEDEIHSPYSPRPQLKKILSRHQLTLATSASEAVRLFPLHLPYDLLLLDHDMEGMYEMRPDYPNTGYQFLKEVLGDPGAPATPSTGASGSTKTPSLPTSLTPVPVVLHSHNPYGRGRMGSLLSNHGWSFIEFPFSPAYVEWLKQQPWNQI